MSNDYTWPSVYFSYSFFFLMLGLAIYFCIRSMRSGYWGPDGEQVKDQVFFEDKDERSSAS